MLSFSEPVCGDVIADSYMTRLVRPEEAAPCGRCMGAVTGPQREGQLP